MTHYRLGIWTQWDRQENIRLQEVEEEHRTQAWIKMNNLFLSVERGAVQLTVSVGNTLRVLLNRAYPDSVHETTIREYWYNEFTGLPGWNDV